MLDPSAKALVAIACGGTGGHLFPGIAVADELAHRGCEVLLLISPKEVDQQAVKSATGMAVATLPAVALSRGNAVRFLGGFLKSCFAAKKLFRRRSPQAVLAMGGFTSAPPVLAGRLCGAVTFLHEANTIPGKANRWLARLADQAFVGFDHARARLRCRNILTTGTPVRPQFKKAEPAACRVALGLDPQRPVLLVTGGSQGATGINDLITHALPILLARAPELQLLHLTGPNDEAKVRAACEQHRCRAVVRAFLAEMDWALGAATVAVSRAGGSSLAELAAVRVPAILIPYPAAADNHQFFNAKAFADSGAALLVEQAAATPLLLAEQILKLAQDESACAAMSRALDRWHTADAAALIAEKILALLKERGLTACDESGEGARSPSPHRTAQSASI